MDIKVTPSVLVLGKESVGKSQLIRSLTGKGGMPMNLRGSTIACEVYYAENWRWVDTPGFYFDDDEGEVKLRLNELTQDDRVLLVVQGTHIDDDLKTLLPLVKNICQQVSIVVTYWDKVRSRGYTEESLSHFSASSGLATIPIDARHISDDEKTKIMSLVNTTRETNEIKPSGDIGWQIDSTRTWFEKPFIGPFLGVLAMLIPLVACVWLANALADRIDPIVSAWLAPLVAAAATMPEPLAQIMSGEYGLVTMGPLLFVWALPTILLVGLLLAIFKSSGVLDRISIAIHVFTRHFGLSGRDVARVAMGYGCNVPAILATRSCSKCTRNSCVSAIAFGSACSYQLAATLSVFAAVGKVWLIVPYILYLNMTMLIYNRVTSPMTVAAIKNRPLGSHRVFLSRPRLDHIVNDLKSVLRSFIKKATPIFIGISIIASLLHWLGVMPALAGLLEPLMSIFNLPPSAALPVVLASIRKDGILLFATSGQAEVMTSAQILSGVYLASVVLPCLVTALTMSRELNRKIAMRMLTKQMTAAIIFTIILAHGATLFSSMRI